MLSKTNPRVAVVGAGITGITTAYFLSKLGCNVSVYDRHDHSAMETSYANGGQLSASNSEVWNSWANVAKAVKWMVMADAPLLLGARPSWHKATWFVEFLAAIAKYEENTIATAKLAVSARQLLKDVAEEEGIDFDCEEKGILHFYRTRGEFEAASRVSQLLSYGGVDRRAVTPEEMAAIEPTLKGEFFGGFFTAGDFTGDIHKFSQGLAGACRRRGVALNFGVGVTDIKPAVSSVRVVTRSDADSAIEEFDKIIICAGIHSRTLGAALGDRLNVYPVKGYSITVQLLDEKDRQAAPWTGLLDDAAKIVTSRLGADRFRIAGTAEFNGPNLDIRASRIAPLLAWCRKNFPEVSTRRFEPWAGLRPMMPNMLPVVGRGRHPRVFYNTGHGHLGWTLSAATADVISTLAAS